MKKVDIFYGSTTGTCEDLARQLARALGVASSDVYSADKLNVELVAAYEILILGTSTWGDGELQDDWYDAVNVLRGADLSGKTIALFGCGDSESYSDTFCDGMGLLYESLKGAGCTFIGNRVNSDAYNFSGSVAVEDGYFVGLALDDVNEGNLTQTRIEAWVSELKTNL